MLHKAAITILRIFSHIIKTTLFRLHRSNTYVNAAYCYRPSSVVCQSVTVVIPAKTDEPIKMAFGIWTLVGPRKHQGAHWCHPATTTGPPMCGGDAAYRQITLTTC